MDTLAASTKQEALPSLETSFGTLSAHHIKELKGRLSITKLAALPNGDIVSCEGQKILRILDSASGEELHEIHMYSPQFRTFSVLPNGTIVLSLSLKWGYSIRIWDSVTRKTLKTFDVRHITVTGLCALSNGNFITVSTDKIIRIWDSVTGKQLNELKGHRDQINTAAVLPNGNIVSGDSEGMIYVWDSATGVLLKGLEQDNSVSVVAALPNGSIVSASDIDGIIRIWDGTIRIWDTGELLKEFLGHNKGVFALLVLPNGKIVSGGGDGTVRIWDSTNGEQLMELNKHTYRVTTLSVLPDATLVIGYKDKKIRIWNVNLGVYDLEKGISKMVLTEKVSTPVKITPNELPRTPAQPIEESIESITPSSEQRKIIRANRKSMERSGSIPDKHAKEFAVMIKIPHAAFAPTIIPCLLKLIDEEQESIIGACYEFDDMILTKAWSNAHKAHKLQGELVVNRSSLHSKKNIKTAIKLLIKSTIAVFQNTRRHEDTKNKNFGKAKYRNGKWNPYKDFEFFENMHHKFFIFKRNKEHGMLVITGSFNWTEAANDRNWENIVILNDPQVIQQFLEQWEELSQHRELVNI